ISPRPRTRSTCSSCCEKKPRATDHRRRAGSSTRSSTTFSFATSTLRRSLDHNRPGFDGDRLHRIGHAPAEEALDPRARQKPAEEARQCLPTDGDGLKVEAKVTSLAARRPDFETRPGGEVQPHLSLEPGAWSKARDGRGREDIA